MLVVALLLQSLGLSAAAREPEEAAVAAALAQESQEGTLDRISFGDAQSENAHNFKGEFTTVTTGFLGASARVSNPRDPLGPYGGDLTFTMKVDPHQRNYVTIKFLGETASVKTMLLINGEQIGFISYGDYTELINASLPNRFYYHTSLLPLTSTLGKDTIELTIRPLNTTGNLTTSTRGFYAAYTHSQAYLNVEDEAQGYKLTAGQTPETLLRPDPTTEEEKQAVVDAYIQEQIVKFNSLSSKVDEQSGGKLSIIRYQDELKFYANVLKYDWSPAQTNEEKRAALDRIFKTIDNHVKDYYNNYRLVLRGGHQGDWGGYYGALGEALYIAEKLIKDDDIYGSAAFEAFLDEPFDAGTGTEDSDGENNRYSLASLDRDGGELTRRGAWERALKANYDFARARLSYIYNQMLYTYEGAWEAHVGLGIIGSSFYEGPERSRRILLEMLGIEPFLGEEVLLGPEGEELDLYHSLFLHDSTAVFTDDFVYKIGKGLAQSKLDEGGEVVRRKPYGEHYYGLTEGGLTRENGFVANYGEAANYLLAYFHKTWDKPGEEEVNDRILKAILTSAHARGYVRYTSQQDGYRIAVTEQMTDERGPSLDGFPAYSARVGVGIALQLAYLEKLMADHEARYSDPEWDDYWTYAREAVGYVQQQMTDNQLIPRKDFGNTGTMSGINYLLQESYDYITGGRADYERFDYQAQAGVVLPHTDFDYYTQAEIAALGVAPGDYEQFAWTDIDNLYVSMRDGDVRLFGALNFRNRGALGNGRLHVVTSAYDRIVQVATNSQFRYEDYSIRPHNVDWDFQVNRVLNTTGAQQALVGEEVPITFQPGVGTVVRDNLEVDTPYAGYPDLLTARYGEYFFIFNTTRDVYGNERDYTVELPTDFQGSTVYDLVGKRSLPVAGGSVTVAPKSALVLKLGASHEAEPRPSHVDFVHALPGNGYVGLSWKIAAGAQSYTIRRAASENGPYTTIATGVTDFYYKDTAVQNGNTYYYQVTGVNTQGEGWDSWPAEVELAQPSSGMSGELWRDDRIGTSAGSAVIGDNGSSIAILGADGSGLAQGEPYDDYNLYMRDIRDSLHYVSQVAGGNSSISARIDSAAGAANGILLRDRLTPDLARYVYFGADESGKLVLQNRTRNSFVTWSLGVISPYDAKLEGYDIETYPYIKLDYDYETQMAHAFVSENGVEWQYVTGLPTLLTRSHLVGVAAAESGSFSEVKVAWPPTGTLTPFYAKAKDQVTLYWNKPKQASWFHLYRTTDAEAAQADPVLVPGTAQPVAGSAWTLLAAHSRATSYEDVLRYGTAYYKLLPVHGDGSPQPFYDLSVSADSLEEVLTRAESYRPEDYTRRSFYLYRIELERIQEALEAEEADIPALIDQLYAIVDLLVPLEQRYLVQGEPEAGRELYEKLAIGRESVIASANIWSNPAGTTDTRVENAWRVFDGDLTTASDTQTSTGWVRADLGEGQAISYARYYPRANDSNSINRINQGILQGSLDGNSWTALHTVSGVTLAKWYTIPITDATAYRYYRYYDGHEGNTNIAELELYVHAYDTTLLGYLLEQAEDAVQAQVFTESSYAALAAVVQATEAAQPDSQAAVDQLAADLLMALEQMELIEGMPLLKKVPNRTIIAEQPFELTLELAGAVENVSYLVSDLPDGASFDGAIGRLTWTPHKGQGGVYPLTFYAAAGELQSSRSFVLTVVGEPSVAPDAAAELTAKQPFAYTVEATDAAGKTLVIEAKQLPPGAHYSTASQRLTWTPGQADYGEHTAVFEIANGSFVVTHTVSLKVMLDVRAPEQYTRGSYYGYAKALGRIESAMQQPGADKSALAAELALAEQALQSWDVLYTSEDKIGIAKTMVTASSKKWGTGESENENGWHAFDGDPATSPDTTNAGNGWVRVDFGEGQAVQVDVLRFLPRSAQHNRMNGAMLKGSNDGINYTTLYTFDGISSATWHAVRLETSEPYRYLRYEGTSANVAELEFYRAVTDHTLLQLAIDEALAIDPERYTAASVETVQTALEQADAVREAPDSGQEEVDEATALLLDALDKLTIRGLWISGPEQADRGEELELIVSLLEVTEDLERQSFAVTFDTAQLHYLSAELLHEAMPEIKEDAAQADEGRVAFVLGAAVAGTETKEPSAAATGGGEASDGEPAPAGEADGGEATVPSGETSTGEESAPAGEASAGSTPGSEYAGGGPGGAEEATEVLPEEAQASAALPGAPGEQALVKLRFRVSDSLAEDMTAFVRLVDIAATGADGSAVPMYTTALHELRIRAESIPVTGILLREASVELEVGDTARLTAQVLPAGAANKHVTWQSSDAQVAAVDADGRVTAHRVGEATVTVTTADGGLTAESAVKVKAKQVEPPVDPPVDPPVQQPAGPSVVTPAAPPTQPSVDSTVITGSLIEVQAAPTEEHAAEAGISKQSLQEALLSADDGIVGIKLIGPSAAADLRVLLAVGPDVDPEGRLRLIVVDTGQLVLTLDGLIARQATDRMIDLRLGTADAERWAEALSEAPRAPEVYTVQVLLQGERLLPVEGRLIGLQLPYTLASTERPTQVVLYSLDEDGKAVIVKHAHYDAELGSVLLRGSSSGTFAAVYRAADFTDTAHVGWAQDAIHALAARSIVEGVGERRFEPDRQVTRAEFAAMLARAFDLLDPTAEASFVDSREGDWHYRAIASAAQLGIVNGQGNGRFGAQETISRQDMAVMAARLLDRLQMDIRVSGEPAGSFADGSAIADYAAASVAMLRQSGLVRGLEDGRFAPQGASTRAQAATLIYRLLWS